MSARSCVVTARHCFFPRRAKARPGLVALTPHIETTPSSSARPPSGKQPDGGRDASWPSTRIVRLWSWADSITSESRHQFQSTVTDGSELELFSQCLGNADPTKPHLDVPSPVPVLSSPARSSAAHRSVGGPCRVHAVSGCYPESGCHRTLNTPSLFYPELVPQLRLEAALEKPKRRFAVADRRLALAAPTLAFRSGIEMLPGLESREGGQGTWTGALGRSGSTLDGSASRFETFLSLLQHAIPFQPQPDSPSAYTDSDIAIGSLVLVTAKRDYPHRSGLFLLLSWHRHK
jgi:hypothetical protein